MRTINYISNIIVPIIIVTTIFYGMKKNVDIFDTFLDGVKEGLKIGIKILPTLIGLFLLIDILRESGIIDIINRKLKPMLEVVNFPSEILPLALLRPISGSGTIAIAKDIMERYGVDSMIGIMSSVIMGSTETTFYIITLYLGSVKVKKTRGILIGALAADLVGIITSVIICHIMT